MEYTKVERHRSFDSKVESPRVPHRMSFDGATTHRHNASGDQLRASFDARDLSRVSVDIKDAVRASFQKERSRSSVDCRDGSQRESPRFGGSRHVRDPPRSSVDGKEERLSEQIRSSVDSPRLSMRLKEAVRAAVEGRLDSVRSSVDSKEALRSASNRSRETSRASTDHRLLVELRESPRLSRDAPRYSCDGRDVLRSTVDSTSRDSLRLAAQKARETPRLSVDGRGPTRASSIDDRESPRSDAASGEPRRRVPSLVARLMGLEDLPDEKPPSQPFSVPQETSVPQQVVLPQKRPSKEAKILKGLLQYNPRPETQSRNELRHSEVPSQERPTLKQMFTARQQTTENGAAQPYVWTGNQESPRPLRLPPRHLDTDTAPTSFSKQQDAKEIGALRQKVVQAMPKQLTEAFLTVLKNSDDSKRMPLSYSDMENRLRQLRLRSSLQEHKTLRQILEAMQTKGLLNGASRPRDASMEHDVRQQEEFMPEQEARYQNTPKQIMLPKAQDLSSDASKVRNLQELKKLGSRLHDQVFGHIAEDNLKCTRSQSPAVSKPVRSPDEQRSPSSGAPIVVMKPIGKPVKKIRGQNPALLIESMPNVRSPQRGREHGGRTSPWGSPVNRPARAAQPGFGFGREPTGRFNSEESAAFKLRREKILARGTPRDVQSEPTTPRSPKLIALPQSTTKFRSSSVSKEAPESTKQLKVTSSYGGKGGESGRRVRSTREKEENSKSSIVIPLKSQSFRESGGPKKAVQEPEHKEPKLRRSLSDGKMSSAYDREGTKSTGPAEVTILRNRSSMGKRVTLVEPTAKRVVVNEAKSASAEDKPKERISSNSVIRTSLKNNVEHIKKKEEPAVVLDHVRVTDGDATDQSSGRTPLVGLTNILQSTEVGSGDPEREGQGVRTPRTAILVKKILPNQEENLVSEIIDITLEQAQPSPVSVLDGATFPEEDVTPLTLGRFDDEVQGHCEDKRDSHILQQADTALQEWGEEVILAHPATSEKDNCQHLTFLRESAKILPPQGDVKPLILRSDEEKVYVRDILVVSGATTGLKSLNLSGSIIDSTVFDYLEEKQGAADYGLETTTGKITNVEKGQWDKGRQVLDRRMLFDCVNDVLETLLVPYGDTQPWMQRLHVPHLRKRPTGQALVQQLWDHLQSLPPLKPCEDICDSLYTVLQKDLIQPGNSWSDFSNQVEDIGLEIEKMIFNELVDETLFGLAQSGL